MNNSALSSIILFDIFILGLILLASINGYKKGGIRSFLSLFWVFISLIATAALYKKIALFLQITFETSSPFTLILSFMILFIIFFSLSRIINFFISGLLKSVLAGSLIGNIIGTIFGAIEAMLIIGIVFMNISFYPVKPPLRDSTSFNTIRQIPIKTIEYCLWFSDDSPKKNNIYGG